MDDLIFVFGSNLAGRHGKGAALCAKKYYGAEQGNGVGLINKSYAIPTKDENLKTLPLSEIEVYIRDFCNFARLHDLKSFQLTPIGTGLAGYAKKDISKLFKKHRLPPNVFLTSSWIYTDKEVGGCNH